MTLPIKSLREEGVPFGAQTVFAIRHLPLLGMTMLLSLSTPLLFFLALGSHAGLDLLESLTNGLEARYERLVADRNRLIALYKDNHNET